MERFLRLIDSELTGTGTLTLRALDVYAWNHEEERRSDF